MVWKLGGLLILRKKNRKLYKFKIINDNMDKKGKFDFWDFLIWAGIALVLVWTILKTFGVMNSPIWIETLPFYGIIGTAIGIAYKFGKMMENIRNIDKRTNRTDEKVDSLLELKEDFSKVKHIQQLCMNGKLSHSPVKKRF